MKPLTTVLIILTIVALVAVPLLLPVKGDPDKAFSGSDDQAEEAIKEHNPDYVRWVTPVWKPPSSEVESGIFAIQAAAGAGVLGYLIGYLRGKASRVGKPDAHV